MRPRIAALAVLLIVPQASADIGGTFFDAVLKANGGAAAKVTVKAGLKYGADGKDEVIKDKIAAHFGRVFKKIRGTFKGQKAEKGSCTSVGRELGYMSVEWKEKDPALAEWIRKIPEAFCTGTELKPPQVWLVKVLETELPHAIVLFRVGEDELVDGFYHF